LQSIGADLILGFEKPDLRNVQGVKSGEIVKDVQVVEDVESVQNVQNVNIGESVEGVESVKVVKSVQSGEVSRRRPRAMARQGGQKSEPHSLWE